MVSAKPIGPCCGSGWRDEELTQEAMAEVHTQLEDNDPKRLSGLGLAPTGADPGAGQRSMKKVGGSPGEGPTPEAVWHRLRSKVAWGEQTPAQTIPANAVVLINETDPDWFLVYFWAGLLANAAIVLANPHWRQREWQQVAVQLGPDVILGQVPPVSLGAPDAADRPAPGQILIATGGTSGQIKFVIHTWQTLTVSAQGFLEHFGARSQPVNSYCVLPLYHVSGLMQALRVWLSDGQLVTQPFKQLEAGQRLIDPNPNWFISLVPTQLQRLLKETATVQWLAQFRAILLGGAPAWPDLLAQAAQLPIALTYGMSETAAQVATLRPEEFHQGIRSNGCPLPHVQLRIHQPGSCQLQPGGTVGRIALQSPALGLGYWPATRFCQNQGWFYPDDLGYLDQRGHLHVVGRASQKIITGGENVFPAEVEAALLATGLVQDACVVGVPDPVWGQAVAALCVIGDSDPEGGREGIIGVDTPWVTPQSIKTALEPILSAYKHPKQWRMVRQLPRNDQGKVNRALVVEWLTASTEPVLGSGDDAGGSGDQYTHGG
ncbi:AMP-binding protein [Leptothoe sp. PORK10 BA2]|uniref:AMP-binding protein n=1 Tax=Leptothoe sp. PORK10 BA2 TaxID=3110254 RepID=UPI002B21F19B|nr:AMP-binding protein [Leptothoe sp. PORK10 BA2]MEA5464092.1 AMP-binding protein [Leptothoe sp. PORK10 BA2]